MPTSIPSERHATHLVKATGAVEIKPGDDLTLAARRLFNHLLAHAYPRLAEAWREAKRKAEEAREQAKAARKSEVECEEAARAARRTVLAAVEEHRISLAQVRRFAAEAREGVEDADNRQIKSAIQRLQKVLVEFNYLQSDQTVWESTQLLGGARFLKDGTLVYKLQEPLLEKLIEPALYSYISLRIIYQFESKYALALYEILKRYADRDAAEPYWQVRTEHLRDMLGCANKLKDWKDFRRYAIDPAIEEIGRLSDFSVELSEVRQGGGRGGGRVVGVVFRIRRKTPAEAEKAAREIEKPKVQRRGERLAAKEDRVVSRALRWLEDADLQKRTYWLKRAEEVGVKVPKAGTARENLAKWVPAMADVICSEENLLG